MSDGVQQQIMSTAASMALNAIYPGAGTVLAIAMKLFAGGSAPMTAAIGSANIMSDGTAVSGNRSYNGANPAQETTLVNNIAASYLQVLKTLGGTVPQPYSQFSAGWNASNNGINMQYLIGPGVTFVYDYNNGYAVTDMNAAKWQLILLALQHSTFDHPQIRAKFAALPISADPVAIQQAIQGAISMRVSLRALDIAQAQPGFVPTVANMFPELTAQQRQIVTNNLATMLQTLIPQLDAFKGEPPNVLHDLQALDGEIAQAAIRAVSAQIKRLLGLGYTFDETGNAQIGTLQTAIISESNAIKARAMQHAASVFVEPAPEIINTFTAPNVVANPTPVDTLFTPAPPVVQATTPAAQAVTTPSPLPGGGETVHGNNPFTLNPVTQADLHPQSPVNSSTQNAVTHAKSQALLWIIAGIGLLT